MKILAALLAALALAPAWVAAEPAPAPGTDVSWQDRMAHHTGVVRLPEARASLNLGEDFYFLGREDARRVLLEWNNPPDTADHILGMVFPKRFKPMDADAWGAIVTYDESGYVSDDDASKVDADALLDGLREGEDEDNAARKKAGFGAVHLVGWAESPSYDPRVHSAVWARDLVFDGTQGHTLNYDIRVLGRGGVVSLDVVAALSALPEVRAAGRRIGQIVVYDPGHRYADYRSGDSKAAYGVAGLVAAGLGLAALKKAGLLALLLAFGKKALVLAAAGVAAAAAWLRRLFGGKGAAANASEASAQGPPEVSPKTPPPPPDEDDAAA